MNRLVIVGNGFDLAHGLKTRYEDFLLDYLIKHIKSLEINPDEISEDDLLKVSYVSKIRKIKITNKENEAKRIVDLFDNLEIEEITNHEYIHWKWMHKTGVNYWKKISSSDNKYIKIELKSRFFSKLIGDGRWTDIEKAYFDELLETFSFRKDEDLELSFKVEKLNKDFDFLKAKILEYLNEVNISIPTNFDYNGVLHKCFDVPEQKYFKRYISDGNYENNKKIYNIIFVNFNYTKLLELCIVKLKGVNPDVNVEYFPIHGSLNNPETIIFGYGDDTNKHYQDLEDEDNEEYLKNIKAFYYPNESHYKDLINTLYGQEFDVFVFGHSLGLSDRVLLKTIFEHENCKAIKLFHRGSKESQFSKRIALSRHFTDKIKMRSKIVDYSDEDVM